ncbi:DUF6624 domain-containing protein [uncultured Winogradskyella sp.]|uniref:DUF6624 domain-containing protein n=1 Tax=uncultured Winogradskyella sp. TaxID=395353 RepID=UPI002630D9D3|nr:DUF6624 domain-containing protein [uncultured Winogradskyella sp.]
MTNQIRIVRITLIFVLTLILSCSGKDKSKKAVQKPKNLIAILDTIWQKEQTPLRLRDSVMAIYGAESKEADIYQKTYRKNHAANIIKVKDILETYGWPDSTQIGTQHNLTICNVLQHADQATREHYIPLMKQAVLDKKLEPRFLVRAEDRIATDKGELQIYGGQMKYYPETKSFNVWPVYDPVNIDKRRAEIGLDSIAIFLKNRFDFNWNLEEQIKRSQEFELLRLQDNNITCTDKSCEGTYEGKEFINGSDIAHQFSNTMSAKVGDQLKGLYNSGNYSKVDFENITMTTEGMGSGKVNYSLSIPFMAVNQKCEAYTAFDHVGGWNHAPALSQRKEQLKDVLLSGQKLDISNLKTTSEGLQEYWIQWKHKVVQAECE